MDTIRHICCATLLLVLGSGALAQTPAYLFVWSGDDAKAGSDFLAVVDADPDSSRYGRVVASVAVPGPTGTPHHTELEMPPGGFLFANAFGSGRSMVFDLGGHGPKAEGGGLVEVTPRGEFVRSSSAMDPAAESELIRPYSSLVMPGIDRIVSTNTAMHEEDGNARTIQVWRLSDLKLLRTVVLPAGPAASELNPGEIKLLADGKTVMVHTFSCGLYQLDGVETDSPRVQHRFTFNDKDCAVPVRIGKFWVQTLSTTHALASFDISDPSQIREVSRLTFDDKQKPHWIAPDEHGRRIVMNSGESGEHRVFIINVDAKTGALQLDARFRDAGSDRPGVSMDGKTWPHGFRGEAFAHGAVFSRTDTTAARN